jgi:hypothetical protein
MRACIICRRALFISQRLALQNSRLLNHARDVRDRFFSWMGRALNALLPGS